MKIHDTYERRDGLEGGSKVSDDRIEAEDAYEARKDALDRAIRFLIPDHTHRTIPVEEVVKAAKLFEVYLARPTNTQT